MMLKQYAILLKIITHKIEFGTIITTHHLNFCIKMSLDHVEKRNKHLVNLSFIKKKIHPYNSRRIIHQCKKISSTTRRGSMIFIPQVTMDNFKTENGSTITNRKFISYLFCLMTHITCIRNITNINRKRKGPYNSVSRMSKTLMPHIQRRFPICRQGTNSRNIAKVV